MALTSTRVRPALLAVLGVLVYWNALSSPLLLDDFTSITTNHSIETLRLPGPLVTPADTPVARRPLVNLSFALNYAIHRHDVRGYHAVNLLVHILAALTLFGIVRRTPGLPSLASRVGAAADDVAFACAAIWLLHPLNSEIVDYVTQRSQGLLGLFYLLTLYCALRASSPHRSSGRWTAATIGCCLAGMLCKESMVTAPLAVILYDRVFLFERWPDLARRRGRLYGGLAACWGVLVALMQTSARTSAGFGTGASPWQYLLNQALIIPRYLLLAVWPQALVVDYGRMHPVALTAAIVPGALLLLALAATLAALVWRPRAAFGAAWFFLTLAPASSIVPVVTEVAAERRMYLPLAGLVVLAMTVVIHLSERLPRMRAALPGICGVLCLLLAARTVLRNREYQNPVRLAQTVIERYPSGRGHVTLGTLYLDRGQPAAAIHEFRQATATYPAGHYALGVALVERNRVSEGLAELTTFVRLDPTNDAVTGARDLIGRILLKRGDLPGASRQFERLLAEHPGNVRAMILLAEVRLAQGRAADAVVLYERGYRRDAGVGRDPAAMQDFGRALGMLNRMAEAERVFAAGAAANPQDVPLQKFWGRALAAMGRYGAAADHFRRALMLAPDDVEARQLLAAVERRLGAVER
ncbi:MAG TPA: tetratricopeptide repeat protein [Vicinamibacterales bacterium]|nr:tetratricopeptide repeat protein [Vicinamibacterales bacterium]